MPKKEIIENKVPETVLIKLPRDRNDESDEVVWINEKRFQIKRGVPVEVPRAVAAALEEKEAMLEYIYDFEERAKSKPENKN